MSKSPPNRKENPPDESLTPGTLIDGARMYAAAADAVNERLPNALHVLTNLLCTSIELSLKAHLRQAGYSEKQLRGIGHDLRVLLEHACKHGLADTGSRELVLAVACAGHEMRLFVYPRKANLQVILPWRLRQMCQELILEVLPRIHGQAALDATRNEPGVEIRSRYPEDLNASAWAV